MTSAPIHLRVPILVDHVNTRCGVRAFPGNTTKESAAVTCAECRRKMGEEPADASDADRRNASRSII